nr:terminase small subunit [uncultured Dysosmobacter sp.]
MEHGEERRRFCRTYLRTMDPDLAAAESGQPDGFALLRKKTVQDRLDRMRSGAAGQIRREDAVRRLAQLAFGRANDAVRLALRPGEADPDALDLSAVAEFKVTEKGVEVKLVDRVRALETLFNLLESGGEGGAAELYRALEEAAGQMEGAWGDE